MKPSERYDGLRPLCLMKQLFVLDICRIHFHCMKKIPESLRPVRAENSMMFVHTELLLGYIILITLPLNFIHLIYLKHSKSINISTLTVWLAHWYMYKTAKGEFLYNKNQSVFITRMMIFFMHVYYLNCNEKKSILIAISCYEVF